MVPDTDRGGGDGHRLAVLPGPDAPVVHGGTVAAWAQQDTRPPRSMLQKYALILLAASPPCQVNGWASDSSLDIPTVPFLVKSCSGAVDMVIAAATVTVLKTENFSE